MSLRSKLTALKYAYSDRVIALLETDWWYAALIAVIIISVGALGFGLGQLSMISQQRPPVTIERTMPKGGGDGGNVRTAGTVVVSRHGSKFHYPWCPGAEQMNAENKVFYASIEKARQAGYEPAQNCPGLSN